MGRRPSTTCFSLVPFHSVSIQDREPNNNLQLCDLWTSIDHAHQRQKIRRSQTPQGLRDCSQQPGEEITDKKIAPTAVGL